jgi:hypothetical protein
MHFALWSRAPRYYLGNGSPFTPPDNLFPGYAPALAAVSAAKISAKLTWLMTVWSVRITVIRDPQRHGRHLFVVLGTSICSKAMPCEREAKICQRVRRGEWIEFASTRCVTPPLPRPPNLIDDNDGRLCRCRRSQIRGREQRKQMDGLIPWAFDSSYRLASRSSSSFVRRTSATALHALLQRNLTNSLTFQYAPPYTKKAGPAFVAAA